MKIKRWIAKDILEKLNSSINKAIIIYGPRQVGKTTLCEEIISKLGKKTLSINADEQRFVDVLSSRDSRKLLELVKGYEVFFLDEAQRIPEIGVNLKILIDKMPELKIIATGSSSFELAQNISEPLTGRKWTYHLYPIAQIELKDDLNIFELKAQLEERLIWGAYPDVFNLDGNHLKERHIRGLASDYLYKDILIVANIKNSDVLRRLIKLLAFQIGNQMSSNELATQLGVSKETVMSYLDLLEKTFVIFKVSGFSRNLRKEVTKMPKYYFYDLGIRNAVIDNFKPISERNDIGQMWENFIISERKKRNEYLQQGQFPYFWRTYTGAEIDYLEETGQNLFAYEIKWRNKKAKAPMSWNKAYPEAKWQLINQENYLEFIL